MAEGLAANKKRRCEARHCFRSRHKVSRYCREHATRYWETGHPVALNIGRRMWRPYVRQAKAFVDHHLIEGHPTVAEAVRWITREITAAESPSRFNDPVMLGYWAALLRVHRSGIEATELLARLIAGELADDRYIGEPGPRFASDTHAAHQRARLLLYVHPLTRPTWAKRTIEPQGGPRGSTPRLLFRTRALAYDRWNSALGLVALKATAAIRAASSSASTLRI